MKRKNNASRAITPVLAIPERLNHLIQRLSRLRIPLERVFSARDLLLAICALLLLLLQAVIPALTRHSTAVCILALLFALLPAVLQGFRLGLFHLFPVEEAAVFAAAVFAFLLGERIAGVLFAAFSVLIWQFEGYCQLHQENAAAFFSDSEKRFQDKVFSADPEKSAERRYVIVCSSFFCVCLILIGILMALLALFHLQNAEVWLRRCLVLLLLSLTSSACYCSGLTHFGAVFSTAKSGGLFRNDQIPEDLSHCRTFTFGKTGTVTDGLFQVIDVAPNGVSEEELLRIAAIAECLSDHPIAKALKAAAGLKEGIVPAGVLDMTETPGKGVSTFFSGHQLYAGNARLLDEHNIWYQIPSKTGTAVHVAVDNTYRGYILVSDSVRESAFEALEELRAQGASRLVMLTGDVPSVSRTVASALNFDMVKSQLSSEEKAAAIRYLRSIQGDRAAIAAVGDGNHDSAVFRESDISICMGTGYEDVSPDLTIESGNILGIPQIYTICRESERILYITVSSVFGSKFIMAVLGLSGLLKPLVITVADFLITITALIASLTCLSLSERRKLK